MRKIRLMVISHTFVNRQGQARWIKLSESSDDIHIRLVAPPRWTSTWFSNEVVFEERNKSNRNFEIVTVDTTSQSNSNFYLIRNLKRIISDYNPDVIYCLGETLQLLQTIIVRWFVAPHPKLIFFTNTGTDNKILSYAKLCSTSSQSRWIEKWVNHC